MNSASLLAKDVSEVKVHTGLQQEFFPMETTMNNIIQGFCHAKKTQFDEDTVLF